MARRPFPAAERLHEFFEANPNEWLSLKDVMAKFNLNEASARTALSMCTKTGCVGRTSVWGYKADAKPVSGQVSAEVSKP